MCFFLSLSKRGINRIICKGDCEAEAEVVDGTERRQTGCAGIHLSYRLLVTILGQIGQQTLIRKEQTGRGLKTLKNLRYS